jgi:methylated-DNA-[protein]-cysteine S-methyltransferase
MRRTAMTETTQVYYSNYLSPVGELLLTASGGMLTGLNMALQGGKPAPSPKPEWRRDDSALRFAREQLDAYFEGELETFDVPLSMAGTPFQKQVWQGLREIPYGTTISYAELARRVGRAGASRAVGSANGRNPIGIVVPCHRVIAADGTLGGYGGGLDRKEWLISHEAAVLDGRGRRGAAHGTLHPQTGVHKLKRFA